MVPLSGAPVHLGKTVVDCMNNQQKELTRQIKVQDLIGGAIRISFDNAANARLAEVEVTGLAIN
jgi:hypothetical protein